MSLALIEEYRSALTCRQREILRLMAERHEAEDFDDAELVFERGRGYVGAEPVAPSTLIALLRACVLRRITGEPGGYEAYAINGDGLRLVRGWAAETSP